MGQRAPKSLQPRGRALWNDVMKEQGDLDVIQRALLEEACRTADRLEELDNIIQGKGVLELMRFRMTSLGATGGDDDQIQVEVKFDNVLSEARQQQTVMKQLLVSLRLPDAKTGQRPQQRGGGRGSYSKVTPSVPTGVSSLDRARAAKAANG